MSAIYYLCECVSVCMSEVNSLLVQIYVCKCEFFFICVCVSE